MDDGAGGSTGGGDDDNDDDDDDDDDENVYASEHHYRQAMEMDVAPSERTHQRLILAISAEDPHRAVHVAEELLRTGFVVRGRTLHGVLEDLMSQQARWTPTRKEKRMIK